MHNYSRASFWMRRTSLKAMRICGSSTAISTIRSTASLRTAVPAGAVRSCRFSRPRPANRVWYQCIGTRFLIRYLNLLDADYPFVDNVKPFGRFLRLFGLSAVMPGYGPLKVAVAVAAMLRHLATTAVQRPSDLMEEMLPTAGDDDAALRKAIVSALPGEIEAFVGALERAGFPEYRSPVVMADEGKSLRELADFVAEHPDTLDALGDTDPDGVMELARGFQADETDDLRQAAERVLDSGAAHFVTMGHTHERVDGDRYFNTGSWTRYYQYEPHAPLQPWSMLRPEAQATFPYWLSVQDNRRQDRSRQSPCRRSCAINANRCSPTTASTSSRSTASGRWSGPPITCRTPTS